MGKGYFSRATLEKTAHRESKSFSDSVLVGRLVKQTKKDLYSSPSISTWTPLKLMCPCYLLKQRRINQQVTWSQWVNTANLNSIKHVCIISNLSKTKTTSANFINKVASNCFYGHLSHFSSFSSLCFLFTGASSLITQHPLSLSF